MALLYLATFGSFIGFSAGFAMLSKTQFPDVQILHYAFFGLFIGALARSMGGAISDPLGGTRVTLVNFVDDGCLLRAAVPDPADQRPGRQLYRLLSRCLWCCS